MGDLELASTVKTLKVERTWLQKELVKVDKAITVLRNLSVRTPTPNGRPRKRTLSAAARRKIARAQKLRWAKMRQAKAAKA
jgi:hypothetical protein